MRITNGMMMNRYGRNLNINLGRMNKTGAQIESGRKFQRGSENPVNALKALQVRRNLTALDQYSANIDVADTWLMQTETAVFAIKGHADQAVDLVIQGKNDTLAPEDRLIIATALRQLQEALLRDLNAQVAGKYLLGGSNTKKVPFTVDADTGRLLFNGEDVFAAESMSDFESIQTPVYMDLTGEFQLDDDGNPVDESTLFDRFTPGVAVIGAGPTNLYNLIGRIAYSFESESNIRHKPMLQLNPKTGEEEMVLVTVNHSVSRMEDIEGPVFSADAWEEELDRELAEIDDDIATLTAYMTRAGATPEEMDMCEREINALEKVKEKLQRDFDLYGDPAYSMNGDGLFKTLQQAQLNALISVVKVGERANFVTYLKDRTEQYIFQAESAQNKLEAQPADEAIMNYKMQDFIYKACLQMGTYIFQPSLLDYLKR